MGYIIGYIVSGVAILVSVIVALVAQAKVNSAFNEYKDVPSSLDMTGAELAEKAFAGQQPRSYHKSMQWNVDRPL